MIRIFTLAVCIPLLVHQAVGQTVDAGKRQYQARCVGCHGEDGTGGGHGPRIVDVPRPRAASQEAVRNLILKGIPDGGMPAFQISDAEADAIAAYVITLKAPAAGAATVPKAASGDAVAGERFFATRGLYKLSHGARAWWRARSGPVECGARSHAGTNRTGPARSWFGAGSFCRPRRAGRTRRADFPGRDRAAAQWADNSRNR